MNHNRITEAELERALQEGVITEHEADLLRRIDIGDSTVTDVAAEDGKTKGTISAQHTAALKKLVSFRKTEQKDAMSGERAADVFKLLDKGVTQTEIVSKLKLDPEEVQRLYKSWTRMKGEDLNQPSVPATVADHGSRLAALEAKVTAGESGEDAGFVDYGSLGEYLDGYLYDLHQKVENLQHIPIENLYRDYECGNCHSKHLVAVRFKCTQCDKESWYGYWPKK